MALETQRCHFTNGGGRGDLNTAHSNVPISILHHAAVDEALDEPGMGHECLSESNMEEALPSDPHAALRTQSRNEKYKFLEFRSGSRASLQSWSNVPLVQLDVLATEQEACFLPADHDNVSDDF